MTNEAKLQARIVSAIKREFPRVWIFHPVGNPYQESGVPDLLVCVHGQFVALEIKDRKPGETEAHARDRTSTTQRVQMRRIVRAGGTAQTVLSEDEALDVVRSALDGRSDRRAAGRLALAGWEDEDA